MSGFIEGVDRGQTALFPARLEDWIGEDNPVRVVDAFVEALDLIDLGFARCAAAATGRPGYHPSVLLKLYIYGYLNRVPSSRRLEREAGRNVEAMWLTGQPAPDHKTIADFRKDNGPAIRKACAQFVELCRRIGVLKNASVAIDGSKFKAVNNRDRNFTAGKVKLRLQHLEASAARYLEEMARIDRQEKQDEQTTKVAYLKEKMVRVREEIDRIKAIGEQLKQTPDGQISLTDPDARSMATYGKGTGIVGYNVQTAVDTDTHLIVAHDVTNVGNDRTELTRMAKAAKEALGIEKIDAVADRGYFNRHEILACDKAGVTPTLPKPATSPNKKRGLFIKDDFVYDAEEDVYICPAKQKLPYRFTGDEHGLMMRRYWYSGCMECPMHEACTSGKQRRIPRWEHEHLMEAIQRRLDENPLKMRERRSTVEHPFGTLKARMGTTHFLMKRLKNVRTEMALQVLAYNLTRMLNLIGIQPLMKAISP